MRILLTTIFWCNFLLLGRTQTAQEQLWLRKAAYYAGNFSGSFVYPLQKWWLPLAFEQKMALHGATKARDYCKLLEKANPKYLLSIDVQWKLIEMNSRLGLELENRAIFERFLNTPDSLFPSKEDLQFKKSALSNLGNWLVKQEKNELMTKKPKIIWSFNRKKYIRYCYGSWYYTNEIVQSFMDADAKQAQLLAKNGYLDGAIQLLTEQMVYHKNGERQQMQSSLKESPMTELVPPALKDRLYGAAWKTYAALLQQKYGKIAVEQRLNTALKDSISLDRPNGEGFITVFNIKWSLGKLRSISLENGLFVERMRAIRDESDEALKVDFGNVFKNSYLYLAVHQE